jgi:outer membrane lipoprotein-sorting protein
MKLPSNRIAVWAFAACASVCTLACSSAAAQAQEPAAGQSSEPGLSAAQIVEKNVAARGGKDAWRKIQTMIWVGHVESANVAVPTLPFVLEMKRPNKTRFEITALNQVAVRVYDGTHGWKLRPSRTGKPDLQPYTPDEQKFAHEEQVIDGPLIDYQAKGVAVSLEGMDDIEGHKAYRLSVRLPSGASHHVWIDAETFLDLKYDRETRNAIGQSATISVFYRNYQSIEGLQIPAIIETGLSTTQSKNKLVIEKIALNPPLEDWRFAKPGTQGRNGAVSIDVHSSQAARASGRPVR